MDENPSPLENIVNSVNPQADPPKPESTTEPVAPVVIDSTPAVTPSALPPTTTTPTPVGMSDMKTSHAGIIFVGAVGLVILIIVLILLAIPRSKKTEEAPVKIQLETTQTPSPTKAQSFSTYTDVTYGFSLNYPLGWHVDGPHLSTEPSYVVYFVAPDDVYRAISVIVQPLTDSQMDVSSWSKLQVQKQPLIELTPEPHLSEDAVIYGSEVGGAPALQYQNPSAGAVGLFVVDANKQLGYQIELVEGGMDPGPYGTLTSADKEEDLKAFNATLDSFKFGQGEIKSETR